ncbi:thioredoxin [Mycobacterium sp. MS1601]|uniref:DsbA family protein n=1 Tax=Mycobacterium sp. MS1601 TaxID=1936029 RepID=UPI000979431C|nr:thioredoxin domain-containing protein [Mycobacterium sp. MS1601]AQA01318.1 thioredoxin [Mycobacterium sp. MS1601]
MTHKTRIALTASLVVAVVVATVVVLFLRDDSEPERVAQTDAGQVVRDNSHRLSSVPDSNVDFVEFLDFECEGCKALYPVVEQLRGEYGDRVNFVIRYFPLSGHFNSERAARAAEAAAQQGQLEPMYKTLFDTQDQWGHKETPADAELRELAAGLGLDMAAFDAAYSDPATAQRVQMDKSDGEALGVQGTPTFFVNGSRLQPRSYEDLTGALDEALGAGR